MDYDVGVIGLSSPPSSAVVTSYRPAVQVRNHGIHDAIASGSIRIYTAGLLVFETEVYSGTLAPGANGTADAIDYWTPPSEGTYIIQGYVSTPLDQVEPNNNLNPVTIIVAGGPVPPTPTVPLHAAQHEEGGTDPVNVDGLPGVLKDRQLPSAHAAQHQAGQVDVLNVAGLAGVLGEAQTPKVHGNAHHNPVMTTAAELTAHSGSIAAHTAATNLANRETTGDDAGLVKYEQIVKGTHLPSSNYNALLTDRFLGAARHASIGAHIPGNIILTQSSGLSSLLSIQAPADYISPDLLFIFEVSGDLHIQTLPGALLVLSSWFGSHQVTEVDFPIPLAKTTYFSIKGAFMAKGETGVEGFLEIHTQLATPTSPEYGLDGGGFGTIYVPGSPKTLTVKADLTDAHPDTVLTAYSGFIRALHPIS